MSLHQTTETAAPTRPATAPALPRVNLLPAEIQEAARFRRVQIGLAGWWPQRWRSSPPATS